MRDFSRISILILAAALAACNKAQTQAAQNPPDQPANVTSGNPADGNLAPDNQSAAQPQETPPVAASGQSYAPPPPDEDNASYDQPVEASQAPPPLPDYDQPPAPGDDYVWTPGYWAYASSGYYWVPGAWVLAPYVGALWTPPWWGFDNGVYLWHAGYWGPYIGYYGGIDYGFGYTGHGYYGAYWNHDRLYYNRSVTNVSPQVAHNVYNYAVPHHGENRVSYNGGHGGVDVRPTRQELTAEHEHRTPPVAAQVQHARQAAGNRGQFAKAGHAKPAALAVSRPLPTEYKAPAARPPAVARTTEQRGRPEAHPAPEQRPAQARRVPENHAAPQPNRPKEARPAPENRPGAVARRETPAPKPEVRRQPQPRPEVRPETRPEVRPETRPQPRSEIRPVTPHPAPQAHAEARPAPQHREPEARLQPQEHRVAPRPAPEARPEARPAPSRPAPKPKEEEHKR